MAWRRGSRRMINHSGTNEEYAQDNSDAQYDKLNRRSNEDTMPQKSSDSKMADQDIVLLLEKINLQLENMKLAEQKKQQSAEQKQMPPNIEQGLQDILSKMMQNNSGTASKNSQNSTQSNNSGNEKQANATNLLNQLLQSSTNSQTQSMPDIDSLDMQTAAEVLSRAQYELSNELESSLKKLKQVISESEKIANKISSLIEPKQ